MDMYKNRLNHLREFLRDKGLDGVVISKLENLHYFSGFTGDDSMLVIGMNSAQLITDFRYIEQAEKEATDFQIRKQEKGLLRRVGELINEEGLQKVGFEGSNLCFDWHGKIAQFLHDADFTTSVSLDSLRQIKSAEELACIRKAMAIGDEAFAYILTYIRPGISENDGSSLGKCNESQGIPVSILYHHCSFRQKRQSPSRNCYRKVDKSWRICYNGLWCCIWGLSF